MGRARRATRLRPGRDGLMGAIIALGVVALALIVIAVTVVRGRRPRKTMRAPPSEGLEWKKHDCGGPDVDD